MTVSTDNEQNTDELQADAVTDPNIVDGVELFTYYRMTFSQAASIALQVADVVHLGDTDHDSGLLRNTIFSDEAMVAYAEAGASHLLLEATDRAERCYNRYFEGRITEDELLYTLDRIGSVSNVTCGDPFPQIRKMRNDLGFEIHGIDPQSPRKINGLIKKMYGSDDSKTFLEGLTKRLEDDHKLGRTIEQAVPEGQKAIMVYGDAHGAQKNDNFPESLDRSFIRISVYADEKAFLRSQNLDRLTDEEMDEHFPDNTINYSDDKAELVYLIKEGTLHLTQETSPELRAAIEQWALDQAVERQRQNTQTEPIGKIEHEGSVFDMTQKIGITPAA